MLEPEKKPLTINQLLKQVFGKDWRKNEKLTKPRKN
jgi:hypothetical protein